MNSFLPRRISMRALIALALIITACATWGAKTLAPLHLVPPGQGISFPREFFGMHIHEANKPGHWPEIAFGSWRLWDAHVGWADLESSKGQWNFTRLDEFVDRAANAGVSILLPLALTPQWASARRDEPSAYGPGQAAEPANVEDWRNYVRTVASRYRGRIHAYEIWNEANEKMFWTGGIPKLVELTKVAYDEIKKIDPSALIVAPSATELDPHIAWLSTFLDAGGGPVVDIISYHLYNRDNPPEALIAWALQMRAQLQAKGYGAKPLWNTEMGLVINNLKPAPGVNWSEDWLKQRVEPNQAASYIVRALLIARALGFERFYWYAWDNRWLGLTEPADASLKAPANAYAQAVVYLMRSRLNRCDRDGSGLWTCSLAIANGHPAQALWIDPAAPDQHRIVPSPFVGHVVRFDGVQAGKSPTAATIDVGPDVTLVIDG